MSLDIYFIKDVTDRLQALHQANNRALALAQRYGMDAEAAGLCRAVYAGALADVGVAFGLAVAKHQKVKAVKVKRRRRVVVHPLWL